MPFVSGIGHDPTADEIIVAGAGWSAGTVTSSIFAYPSTGTRKTGPIRVLSGANTRLGIPIGIILDGAHDEIIVSNQGMFQATASITAYPRAASDDTPPIRTLWPTFCGAGERPSFGLLDLDGPADELVVIIDCHTGIEFNHYTFVVSYPRGATGPTRETAYLGLMGRAWSPQGIAVDQSTGDRWITTSSGYLSSTTFAIEVYLRTASGWAEPFKRIAGPSTMLNAPWGIAIDQGRGEVYVANEGGNSITVYPLSASGDAPPIRKIEGSSTGLLEPWTVAICR